VRLGVIAAIVAVAVAVVAASGQQRPAKLRHMPIDPARISHDVRILSSDLYEGRGLAGRGETLTLDYLVKRFKVLGLKPGGEHGSWLQAVPMDRFETTGPITAQVSVAGAARPLVAGRDVVLATLRPVDRVRIEAAPLVFVGYGVAAPERNWDDFKGYDLRGKIAVVLVNDPDFETPDSTLFGGRAETYYGRWSYKFEEAARRGALGVLIVHETAAAGYGWPTLRTSFAGPQFDLVRPDAGRGRLLMQGWIQRGVAVDLFHAAGLDFEALRAQARRADFKPVDLTGATFSASYAVRRQRIVSHNVLARLPGVGAPGETVIYSAHWDHFGIGAPSGSPLSSKSPGAHIYHGAVDDGTGLAGVLELARVFSKAPPTRRSVVFAAFTAEEPGQLGAEFYAAHPIYPLARTVADINIDVLQTAGPAHDLVLVGPGRDTLEDDLARAAARQDRRVTPEDHPEAGAFFRGDQIAFARKGVPVLPLMAIGGGPDLIEGGRKAGDAWLEDYVAHRYHQPEDRWSPDWDLRGAAQDVAAVYEVGRDLAVSDQWPQWKPGSEFAAGRRGAQAPAMRGRPKRG
jgi:Zn-dependent M28 family amino/carboxypeptidase